MNEEAEEHIEPPPEAEKEGDAAAKATAAKGDATAEAEAETDAETEDVDVDVAAEEETAAAAEVEETAAARSMCIGTSPGLRNMCGAAADGVLCGEGSCELALLRSGGANICGGVGPRRCEPPLSAVR